MTPARHSQSGVTLIEMLVALSISAMIGVAGFSMLDSITRAEDSVSGRLDHLQDQNRAFVLFDMDTAQARSGVMDASGALTLGYPEYNIIWTASADGVRRRIVFADETGLTQNLLADAATLGMRPKTNLVELRLTEAKVMKLARLTVLSQP